MRKKTGVRAAIAKEFDENPIRTMLAIGIGFVLTIGTTGVLLYMLLGNSFSASVKYDDAEIGFSAGQVKQ